MRPIFTDQTPWFLCRSVTLVTPAKTAEPIQMLFGLRTWVVARNHVFDGGPDLPMRRAILRGKGRPSVKYGTLCGHLCKNGWTSRDAVWVIGATWQIQLNLPPAVAMRPHVKLLWLLVLLCTTGFGTEYWHRTAPHRVCSAPCKS